MNIVGGNSGSLRLCLFALSLFIAQGLCGELLHPAENPTSMPASRAIKRSARCWQNYRIYRGL
jgi:hypothetical protein